MLRSTFFSYKQSNKKNIILPPSNVKKILPTTWKFTTAQLLLTTTRCKYHRTHNTYPEWYTELKSQTEINDILNLNLIT